MNKVSSLFEYFVRTEIQWTVHYPVYMNTFCFAHHLAQAVFHALSNPTEEDFRIRFMRHDWSNSLPNFTFTSDVEIFVALDDSIEEARSQGHIIEDFAVFPFTNYDPRGIFVRNGPNPTQYEKKTYLITDVEVTARSLLKQWSNEGKLPIEIINYLPDLKPQDIIIRHSSSRCVRDLVGSHRKIYLMSAPMSWYFDQDNSKYSYIPIPFEPVSTNMVIRANSGIGEDQVRSFVKDLKKYYLSLYKEGGDEDLINEDLCNAYVRMAKTIGQEHPFPDLAAPPAYKPEKVGEPPASRYREILNKHHIQPGIPSKATET